MRRPLQRARGFTLAELVVSMSIMTVLIGGLASTMLLASRAIPDGQGSLDAVINACRAAENMAEDLYTAQSFSERSPNADRQRRHCAERKLTSLPRRKKARRSCAAWATPS